MGRGVKKLVLQRHMPFSTAQIGKSSRQVPASLHEIPMLDSDRVQMTHLIS